MLLGQTQARLLDYRVKCKCVQPAMQENSMTVSTPLSGVNHPFKGILLIVLATFLFSSHDALSKYLAGFYPIVMVVWARYLVPVSYTHLTLPTSDLV